MRRSWTVAAPVRRQPSAKSDGSRPFGSLIELWRAFCSARQALPQASIASVQ